MTDWHYELNGEAKGPVSDNQLKALCEAGVVHGESLIWRAGYANWVPLRESDFAYATSAGPAPAAAPAYASDAPGQGPQIRGTVEVDDMSMWGFFVRALTSRYLQFTGRARRKEYWSYVLFWALIFIALLIAGVAIDAAMGNIDETDPEAVPFATMILGGAFYLGTLLPGIAVTVRRLHDVLLTGWLILLNFVPYIGGIALFVIMLIPTQYGETKHGPAPKAPRGG